MNVFHPVNKSFLAGRKTSAGIGRLKFVDLKLIGVVILTLSLLFSPRPCICSLNAHPVHSYVTENLSVAYVY